MKPASDPDLRNVLFTFVSESDSFLLGCLTPGGMVEQANPGLERLFPERNAAGKPLAEVVAEGHADAFRTALAACAQTGQAARFALAVRPSGALFRCQLSQAADGSIWLLGEPVETGLPAVSGAEELQRLETLALLDPVTGLANRRLADRWLTEAVALAAASAGRVSLTCVVADIDYFKGTNDRLGHAAGDQVLRVAAETMRAGLRGADRLARLGGDEFLLLLPDTDLPAALAVAERLRAALAATRPVPDVPLTASFGVAQLASGESAEALFNRADQALLLAKRNGRNRVEAAGLGG